LIHYRHLSPWHESLLKKSIPASMDVSAMSPNTCQ
jgi:hypothetical protein